MTPKYTHECDSCTFLGTYNDKDLYHCIQVGDLHTVIARNSSNPADYFSGINYAKKSLKDSITPELRVAYLIAKDKGLIT